MTDQPLTDREDAEAEPPDDALDQQTHTRPGVNGADEGEREQSLPDE